MWSEKVALENFNQIQRVYACGKKFQPHREDVDEVYTIKALQGNHTTVQDALQHLLHMKKIHRKFVKIVVK